MRADLPRGYLTFVFSDIEGSTRLLLTLGAELYARALGRHRDLVRAACRANGGVEVDTQGDAFFLSFESAAGALAAASEIAGILDGGPLEVRIGIHSGTALVTEDGYVGNDVHIAARIAAAGSGGQILVSGATANELTREAAAQPRFALHGLGAHRLKDVEEPVALFQLGDRSFPPLRTVGNSNLPSPLSTFVGRGRELAAMLARLADGARLLSVTGPGGAGKTRLALAAARASVPRYPGGVFWVDLADVYEPGRLREAIAQSIGARGELAAEIGVRQMLIVLDNFEHIAAAAVELPRLLASCPNLTLLVTTRETLRVQGELELEVPPLAAAEAIELFCVRSGGEPSDDIAELCARLDSLPLAIELAAARTRILTPRQMLDRFPQLLDIEGARDADARQRTLRASIRWSYDLLSDDEQGAFRRLAVLEGATLETAEEAAATDLTTLHALVEKSLVRVADERYSLLATIREFAIDQVSADESDVVKRRLRRRLVLTGRSVAAALHSAEEGSVSAALAPDLGSIRLAVDHALAAGEPDDVGWLLGALYPFLISHGYAREAYEWTELTLAQRDRLSSRALAEALSGGGEIARFVGELDRALELKEELARYDGDLQRPNWRVATLADLSEVALDQCDFDRARAYAEESAAAGGGPRASLCLAELALRSADPDAAELHARVALAGFQQGAFNYACALEIFAEAARRRGDGAAARERFCDALSAFVGLGDSGGIADCLDGLARLAADAGDAERGGRLEGAAAQLRESRGRRPIRPADAARELPPTARAAGRAMTVDEAVAYALVAAG